MRVSYLLILLGLVGISGWATAADMIANFNTVGAVYPDQTNRFFVNVSCLGESDDFMKGDLVDYQIIVAYGSTNKIVKDSKFVFDVPCTLQSNQVFSETIPSSYQSVVVLNTSAYYQSNPVKNVTVIYQARRFDMPINLLPIKYSQTFEVLQPVREVTQNETNLQFGGVSVAAPSGLQFGFNLFWVAVALLTVGLIVLFFRNQVGLLLILGAIVLGLIAWFFKV